jgi:hypothetical protein
VGSNPIIRSERTCKSAFDDREMPSDAVSSTFHTVAVAMARPEAIALAKEIGVTDVIKERGEEAVEHYEPMDGDRVHR